MTEPTQTQPIDDPKVTQRVEKAKAALADFPSLANVAGQLNVLSDDERKVLLAYVAAGAPEKPAPSPEEIAKRTAAKIALAENAARDLLAHPAAVELAEKWESLSPVDREAFVRFAAASRAVEKMNGGPLAEAPGRKMRAVALGQNVQKARAVLTLMREFFEDESQQNFASAEERSRHFLQAFASTMWEIPELPIIQTVLRDDAICRAHKRDSSGAGRARLAQFHSMTRKEVMKIAKAGIAQSAAQKAA